ncbi:hypothetical protein H2248_003918 [Termitomyces sp. 'cryptogamus']|nr:hypothetical protein H2248_003918 [Termitomyces sp. 'cryptogamus']
MLENTIELEARQETLRKQATEELSAVGPGEEDDPTSGFKRPAKTEQHTTTAHVQFVALFMPLFLAGWNDGTTGPLLPKIQSAYDVNFTIVSLIFVFACLGFLTGSLINIPLSDKLGFGKVIVLGSIFQMVGYMLMVPALPFPAFVVAYAINGVGVALQDAQANGFVASLDTNAEAKMGVLHAVYGAGALCSPLVATQFAQQKHWSLHYLASLGVAIINTLVLIGVFRFKRQDDCLRESGQMISEYPTIEQSIHGNGKFRQILCHKTVQLLALYILIYVGVEVTTGSWIVTYIIQERHGGPSSGYISTGFFAGLMIGRVALLWVNEKVGERRVIFLYTLLAIGLEMVIWFVPSLIGDAIAVSVIGILLGPMYPIAMNHAGRVLPRWILTGSIGWIAGFGQAGSAILPFMTGAISSKYGIKSMQPLLVAMMVVMVIMWGIVPSHQNLDYQPLANRF